MTNILMETAGAFETNYNRLPFQFSHNLKTDALFQMPSLIKLAQRMPRQRDKYWQNGHVAVSDNWNTAKVERKSLVDTLEGLRGNDSLVILKHIEQDPIYAPVLREVFGEILGRAGPKMRREVIMGRATLLLTSPKRVTAYHMDADCNYLFQIAGNKQISVFDQSDPSIVPTAKIEEFHAGNQSCLKFEDGLQTKAREYELSPGLGVHVPVYAPHWVQNYDNVSISLSINFELKPIFDHAHVLRANRWLRKLGLPATEPGISPVADRLKLAAVRAALRIRDKIKSRPYRLWTPRSI